MCLRETYCANNIKQQKDTILYICAIVLALEIPLTVHSPKTFLQLGFKALQWRSMVLMCDFHYYSSEAWETSISSLFVSLRVTIKRWESYKTVMFQAKKKRANRWTELGEERGQEKKWTAAAVHSDMRIHLLKSRLKSHSWWENVKPKHPQSLPILAL